MEDLFNTKTDQELQQSILAELAKATNEIQCAQGDIKKAQSRISFLVMLTNKLLERKKDQQK